MAHCAAATERPLPDSVKRAHHQEAPPALAARRHKEEETGRPGAASRAAGAVGGGMRRAGGRAVDRRVGVAAQRSAVAMPWRCGATEADGALPTTGGRRGGQAARAAARYCS